MNAPLRTRIGLTALSFVGLAGPVLGQGDAAVQSDMDFARALASRFAYIDMAEEVMGSLEEKNLSPENEEALGLLKCDVYAAGAKTEPSAVKRLGLYDKAIQAFRDYMDDNKRSEYLPQAQRNYVDLVNNYGRVLEIKLDDEVGDEAAATREKIRDVLDDGLKLTGNLVDALAGAANQVEKLERWRLMLNRGQMLLTLANVSEDGTWHYSQAEQVLEDLALEAGETSGPGLNAYVLLAKVKMAQGEYLDAAAFAEYVVDVVMPATAEGKDQRWNGLSFEEKSVRWKLAELATATLVDAYMSTGDEYVSDACAWALHYYNSWRVEGFDVSPLGYLSLLSCARALLDSGGYVGGGINQGNLQWFETQEAMNDAGFSGARNTRSSLDMALSIAQEVNDANRGNTLQIRAQKVIADITSRPGVVVSPDILYEAAQGEYNAQNYIEALQAFKGILAQLENRDEATKQEYAPKVLYYMGRALDRNDRQLEAAMAFREGATTWKGDPEYQPKLADAYYRSIGIVKRSTNDDPVIQNMFLEAERILGESDGGRDINWAQAERAYGKDDYADARTKYMLVPGGEANHERARVKAALCLYKMKDYEGAKKEFRDYLESYVPDPEHTLTTQAEKTRRQEAMAQSTFYLGRIAYSAQNWEETIQWLGNYDEAYPAQTSYGPNALYMVVMAHIAEADLEAAKSVCQRMVELYSTHSITGTAASNVYGALKQEQDAAEEAGDEEESIALKTQMAEYLHLSNELASEPKFDNLRAESKLWLELENWEEARATLETLRGAFGSDPEYADDLETHVLPDLGLALLELKRVPEAYAVLDPLVPKDDSDDRKPKADTVRWWCRSVAGWVEGDEQNIVEVPGNGGGEDLRVACDMLIRLTDLEKASSGGWNCPWFELKFELAYAYYQWGQEDSTKTTVSMEVIKNLRDQLGDPSMERVQEECGNDVLRRRFLWLWDKVQ